MDVHVQSFREFKSSQMATAAARGESLSRYVTAVEPTGFDGPPECLETHEWLRYLEAVLNRGVSQSDLGAYVGNYLLDWFGERRVDCDLFVGYSGASLRSMKRAADDGATTVVYRGAPHGAYFKNEIVTMLREGGLNTAPRRTERMAAREAREYKLADVVWVPSVFVRRTLESYGVDGEKVTVFPYGIDLEMFSPEGPTIESAEGTVLYVGSITPEKGVHILLDAFESLEVDKPTPELLLVGKVDRRLRERIAGIENCRTVGWVDRDELAEYYRSALLTVCPSLADGFASVVIESMACGCPVLTTENVGASDLVERYDAGTVVTANNPAELKKGIQMLLTNRSFRLAKAENSYRAIEKGDLNLERRLNTMWDIMRELGG